MAIINVIESQLKLRERLQQAVEVVRDLDEWVEANFDGACNPLPSLTFSRYTLSVNIGSILVWEMDNNEIEELTVESCVERYRKEISYMMGPLFAESK